MIKLVIYLHRRNLTPHVVAIMLSESDQASRSMIESSHVHRLLKIIILLVAFAITPFSACTGIPPNSDPAAQQTASNATPTTPKSVPHIGSGEKNRDNDPFDWAGNNGYNGPIGSGGAVQGGGSIPNNWDPNDVTTTVSGVLDGRLLGLMKVHDRGDQINQYLGWALFIEYKSNGKLNVIVDEGPYGRGRYQAKVTNVGPKQIIFITWPVHYGLQRIRLTLRDDGIIRFEADDFSGRWYEEACTAEKVSNDFDIYKLNQSD